MEIIENWQGITLGSASHPEDHHYRKIATKGKITTIGKGTTSSRAAMSHN
jgi:hypothetical protein